MCIRDRVTYSEPIARATFLQFSYQFQYKYSESDKTTFDMLDYPEWDINLSLIHILFVCPKRRLTVSMGTPCDKSTVVAFVWRAT